ncbi:SdpI family protein [Mucilaginibacter sp. CSA2-8R]|uniref:SdpI family protein n=1 Tax=Mucilaginibacter sp. CSA2-8R TaxID=3141542 RepID=UPI00315CCD43
MKKFTNLDVVATLIWLLPFAYLYKVYPSLPAKVPLHFNINGKPDRYGSTHELLMSLLLLTVVGVATAFLVRFLPKIDPKKMAKYSAGTFQKMFVGMSFLFVAIEIMIITSASHRFDFEKILLPLLGIFFAFLGNMMYSLKPNYFAGVRTPWTLESEDTWRATHQLAGKIWFVGGMLITIITLFLPATLAHTVFISLTIIMALWPTVYSYLHFKKHKPNAVNE